MAHGWSYFTAVTSTYIDWNIGLDIDWNIDLDIHWVSLTPHHRVPVGLWHFVGRAHFGRKLFGVVPLKT
jgi:hypothetical protein